MNKKTYFMCDHCGWSRRGLPIKKYGKQFCSYECLEEYKEKIHMLIMKVGLVTILILLTIDGIIRIIL